jgi:KUP system potassium uptake protein
MPLSLTILIGLFILQSRGTQNVGRLFGPVMVVWFITISALGFTAILKAPAILGALNPYFGLALFLREPWIAFVSLGSVVLAVTGCETLYADIGHFGKFPIRFAWLAIVLPALLLNYFGQGAALLLAPGKVPIAFYSVAPDWAHYPLVALATVAAVIASQAVISGAYSMIQQAIQLGYVPRMDVEHTSREHIGQIYLSGINWTLCVGVIALVLGFGTSSSLAAAYGIAVTGTMAITTILAFVVARTVWQWRFIASAALFGAFLLVDIGFFAANLIKIVDGGWFPLAFGLVVFMLMMTWKRGRQLLQSIRSRSKPSSQVRRSAAPACPVPPSS